MRWPFDEQERRRREALERVPLEGDHELYAPRWGDLLFWLVAIAAGVLAWFFGGWLFKGG